MLKAPDSVAPNVWRQRNYWHISSNRFVQRDRPVFIDGDDMVEAFAAGLSSEPALVS